MPDSTTNVLETPAKGPVNAIEKPKKAAETAIESGDVSGVYRIARGEVDQAVTQELSISKIDDADVATVAGPELIALKQADAEFEHKAEGALGDLKKSFGETQLHDQEDEEEESDVSLELVETKPEISAPKLEEKSEVNPEQALRLETVNKDLKEEEMALAEFVKQHGKALTKLEEAYLDALQTRIAALKTEQGMLEGGDETSAADPEQLKTLQKKAEQAEAEYASQRDEYLADESAKEFQPIQTQEQVQPSFGQSSITSGQPLRSSSSDAPSMMRNRPGPMRHAFGKFMEGLKFWKHFTR